MIVLWALVGAVLILAGTIVTVAWVWLNASRLDVLDDEEIAERLAPCVAAELLIMSSAFADREREGGEPIG